MVVTEGDEGSEFAFATEILAVECEAFGEEVAVSREPLVDGPSEGVGIDLVDDVVESVVTGEEELAANRVAAGETEGGALVLVEGTAFGPDGFDIGSAAEVSVGNHS